MNYGLRGKAVLITGAAGGCGGAIADVLAGEGCNLLLHDVDRAESKESLAQKCAEMRRQFGVRAEFVCADLARADSVVRLFQEASEIMPLDLLVNNAGIWPTAYVPEMTAESFSTTLAINLTAPFLLCREFVNRLRAENRQGKIVNMVSQAAFHGSTSGHAHYAASKAGLVGFSISLAREMAPYGIHVNCVAPGMMRTPMNKQALAEREDQYLERIPLRRIADPHEVAYAVAFLLGDKSDYMTGTTMDLTGGMLMR